MKPLRIDFIAPTAWRWVWRATLVLASLSVALGVLKIASIASQTEALAAQAQALHAQTADGRGGSTAGLRPESKLELARMFRADLNRVFSAAETLKVPGARLRVIQIDVVSNSARLEYELDTMSSADHITQHLNSTSPVRPWQLASLHNQAPSSASSPSPGVNQLFMTSPASAVRGIWTCRLDQL